MQQSDRAFNRWRKCWLLHGCGIFACIEILLLRYAHSSHFWHKPTRTEMQYKCPARDTIVILSYTYWDFVSVSLQVIQIEMKMPLSLAKSSSKWGVKVSSSTFTGFETNLTHDKIDHFKNEKINDELVAQTLIAVMGCRHQPTIQE